MYSPQYAIETNRTLIDQVIQENSFATLFYKDGDKLESFHLPLFMEGKKLVGHMAKANSAWKTIDQKSILVIFHGPHCYISPTMYGTEGNVPTWNYISVQVRGKVTITQDQHFLREALVKLGQVYDPSFDIVKNINERFELVAGIVGIEISMDEIFAKFKLAQSKSVEERKNVIKVLEKSQDTMDQKVAKAMAKTMVKTL